MGGGGRRGRRKQNGEICEGKRSKRERKERGRGQGKARQGKGDQLSARQSLPVLGLHRHVSLASKEMWKKNPPGFRKRQQVTTSGPCHGHVPQFCLLPCLAKDGARRCRRDLDRDRADLPSMADRGRSDRPRGQGEGREEETRKVKIALVSNMQIQSRRLPVLDRFCSSSTPPDSGPLLRPARTPDVGPAASF